MVHTLGVLLTHQRFLSDNLHASVFVLSNLVSIEGIKKRIAKNKKKEWKEIYAMYLFYKQSKSFSFLVTNAINILHLYPEKKELLQLNETLWKELYHEFLLLRKDRYWFQLAAFTTGLYILYPEKRDQLQFTEQEWDCLYRKLKLSRTQSFRGSYASMQSKLKILDEKRWKDKNLIKTDRSLLMKRLVSHKKSGRIDTFVIMLKLLKNLMPEEDLSRFVTYEDVITIEKLAGEYAELGRWEDYISILANWYLYLLPRNDWHFDFTQT